MRSCVELSVVERVEDGEREKKKNRRRSSRRSKQNNSSVSASGSVSVSQGETVVSTVMSASIKDASSNENTPECHSFSEHVTGRSSDPVFSSMPTMHINEHVGPREVPRTQNPSTVVPSSGGRVFSKSCSEPVACREPSEACFTKDSQMGPYNHSSPFKLHWSGECVNEALERGDVFLAVFRVNAHNRLEAYCKIEGVPVDILINGVPAQNRAVEGDVVAIKVDPLPFWTRMKGSIRLSNSSALTEDSTNSAEMREMCGTSCKGKNKMEGEFDSACGSNNVSSERFSAQEGKTFCDGCRPFPFDGPSSGFADGQNQINDPIAKICALISSYPSKRPTGRVVSIIERSPRRDAIVGFLYVKQWIAHEKGYWRDPKKNKNPDHDYIDFMPNDARFPRMMVHVEELPDCIEKRLYKLDVGIERELVAAQIESWSEESPIPHARVLHVFGHGSELQPHIDAILFENAINSSEFSSESLLCLPPVPWDVPRVEFQTRMDLRSLSVFTIDPSTAIDLDDALSVEMLTDGIYRVGVHIADVSYFVKPDTPLDAEAQVRSTSVYMSRQKLPMLPPLISEDLGSLNPGLDRLTFTIFWDIDGSGSIVHRWIGRTVIRSCCKLSYEHAQDILDGVNYSDNLGGLPQLYGSFKWSDVVRCVHYLNHIARILKEKRLKDGALQLESSKIVFLFDEDGIPYDSKLSQRKESNFLVEEFMLLANHTAAEVISRAFPETALLRRHPEPNMRKLKEFEAFCTKHELTLDTSSSSQIQKSLGRIKETLKDDSVLLDILMSYASRPMQLAMYFCTGDLKDNEDDWAHYALAVPFYTHFTSPLRRYPDIVVHRMMAAALDAERSYLKQRRALERRPDDAGSAVNRCFTGLCFDKNAAESEEAREAFSAAALKHRIPCLDILKGVAAHCNERKLASRHVKVACDKLYMWVLLKKKEVLLSEARVLGVGPRFMSIYIPQLAIERRIYYDEIEGLSVEWLEATSTVLLTLSGHKSSRRAFPFPMRNTRPLEESVLVVSPLELNQESNCSTSAASPRVSSTSESGFEIQPLAFPVIVSLLSTIPVALHAVGGEGGPIDICARLYGSSYLR
ncbi:DIS3-like exonuclease 2 [Punica granatum]|uniref:DIS3-like exonuclease 2 n=1 Tax=Punica granatum TaxID=22663 RepID=A0A6P8DAL8_PUNGR|nr:DIS3-like exonuclease 2 [Punica granatum]